MGWTLLGAILIVIGPSCSPQKHYKTLSFFFDGVPDPNAPKLPEGFAQSAGGAPKLLSIVHKPYAEGKCGDCHEGDTTRFESFRKLSSDVCRKCHENVLNQYPVMHGPVSAGECLLCHNPHESSVKGLLNDNSPAVCAQCHISEFLPLDPPEHQDPKQDCLQCHVAHGGEKHGLLSLQYLNRPATQPGTTQPATQPGTQALGGNQP